MKQGSETSEEVLPKETVTCRKGRLCQDVESVKKRQSRFVRA